MVMSSVMSVMVSVLMSAGKSDAFSLVYFNLNKFNERWGMPLQRMYKTIPTMISVVHTAAPVTSVCNAIEIPF